jgi:CheY-like chemotaxis protein
VFELFSQVEDALTRSQGGLGIGLSLVRRLVDLHGGSISAHSDGLGKGSEFVVRLPIVVEDQPGPTTAAPDRATPTSEFRILIVDDNLDAAESLAMLLEMVGNHVRTAHDGEEAVQAACAFRPHVVLCDIGLPRMNGYDAARAMRREPWGKDMVLIAVTGWGQEADKRRSAEAGFDRHLVKPIDPSALIKLLAGLQAR